MQDQWAGLEIERSQGPKSLSKTRNKMRAVTPPRASINLYRGMIQTVIISLDGDS